MSHIESITKRGITAKMNVNLNQLRSFYMTVKYGSITAAAKKMYVTPPAVTMQIKKLEEWLCFRLLHRDTNPIKMAESAAEIYRHAETIFSSVEHLETYLERIVKERKREVMIGAHTVVACHIMPNLIAQLKKEQPELDIKIVIGKKSELVDKLLKHTIHCAVKASSGNTDKYRAIPLFSEDIILVAAKNSKYFKGRRVSMSSLQDIPLLMHEHDSATYQIVNTFLKRMCISPDIIMDDLSGDVMLSFVQQDTGVAFVNRFAAQNALDKGGVQEIEIAENTPLSHFEFVFLDEKNKSPHFEAIVSFFERTKFSRSTFLGSR